MSGFIVFCHCLATAPVALPAPKRKLLVGWGQYVYFFNTHLRICLPILERQERKEKGNIDQLLPIHTLTSDQTHNPGMCPDQEPNPQLVGEWDGTPTN